MEYVKELRMLEVVLNGSFALAGWCLSMSGEGAFRQVLVAAPFGRARAVPRGIVWSSCTAVDLTLHLERVVVPHVDVERSRMWREAVLQADVWRSGRQT